MILPTSPPLASVGITLAALVWVIHFAYIARTAEKRSRIANVYWATLLGMMGTGYVFAGVYELFQLADPYPFIRVPNQEVAAAWLILMASGLLLAGCVRMSKSDVPQSLLLHWTHLRVPSFVVLVIAYFLSITFRTFAVGADVLVVLPYRLNGVLELFGLFLLPLWLASAPRSKRGRMLGAIALVGMSLVNLTMFGSKWAAVYPVVVYCTFLYVGRARRLRTLGTPLIAFALMYTVLNPELFSDLLVNEPLSGLERIQESIRRRGVLAGDPEESILLGLRNASVRISGYVPLQWSLYTVRELGESGFFAGRLLNQGLLNADEGNTWALGHFGYFVVVVGHGALGTLAGATVLVLLGVLLRGLARMKGAHIHGGGASFGLLLGSVVLLVDGRYELIDYYLQAAACTVASGLMLKEGSNSRAAVFARKSTQIPVHKRVLDMGRAEASSGARPRVSSGQEMDLQ